MATNPRDTWNYKLIHNRRTVYVGITNNPEARVQEHENNGKVFDHMRVEGRAKTRESARAHERENLATYRRNHGGRNPKYNDTDHG
jgi:predicted GIY-YIG superfamily endonuclease